MQKRLSVYWKAGTRKTVFRPRCDYQSCRKIQHPTGLFIQPENLFYIFYILAGLMRCDEIIHENRSHVSIFPDQCQFFCPKRKNDQRSQGHYFYFARSDKITCPVSITEKLLSNLPDKPGQPLVCRLSSKGTAR